MARRKGLMVGKGKKGYHNVLGKDPYVHSQSARGIKQPQRFKNQFVNVQWRGFQKADGIIKKDGSSKYPIKRDAIGRILLYNKKKGFYELSDRFPKDSDGDGVIDEFDCKPNDPSRQDTNKEDLQEERELLKEEYKNLLNRDIDDYSIGIKNIAVRKRMKDIEENFTKEEFKDKLSKIEGWKDTSKTYSDGSKSVEFTTKDKKLSISKDFEGRGWNIGVTSLRNDEPPQLMADTHNTKEEAYNKAKEYMKNNSKYYQYPDNMPLRNDGGQTPPPQ